MFIMHVLKPGVKKSPLLKKSLSVLVILLFISAPVFQSHTIADVATSGSTFIDTSAFDSLQNISLADDAFHNSTTFFHIESWYFDAVFEQNYSMAVVVTILQRKTTGFVLEGLYLYKDTNLIAHPRKLMTFQQCFASAEQPFIKLGNATIITGTINESAVWTYHVSLEMDGQGIDLQFVNITKGWKTDIRGGWWLVIPQLRVTGHIQLNGETIPVSGAGYHDHNWFYLYTPLIQKGWQFINVAGDDLGVTMVKVMKNRFVGESITVLNQKDRDPSLIPSDDVHFLVTEYMVDHGRLIPKNFLLRVSADQVQVDLTMVTCNVHYVKLPFLNYWRYHLRITGTITVGSVTERIDSIRISELLRFL